MNFINEYYPSLEELTDEAIATERAAVVADLQPLLPDADLSPGTPTGDWVITPLAVARVAMGEANSRLMSDLDLSNVAAGVIYSCDFVKAYLGNFAVYDVENFRATGVVRLTYSTAVSRELFKSSRFQFGGGDTYSIKSADPDGDRLYILPPGSSHNGAADTYILAQTSATTWAVDIPLETVMTTPVSAGASGTANFTDDTLVGISAPIDFLAGIPSASLSDLARMARKTAVSITAGSKEAFKAMTLRHWPETYMISPVVTGDQEMQRSPAGTAMVLQAPAADVYVRSSRDITRETQVVKLELIQPTAGSDKVFRGKVDFVHRPSRLVSVSWSGTTDSPVIDEVTMFTKKSRNDLYGSLHCGTRHEDLYLQILPLFDEFDTPLVPLTDEGGKQYAYFTITYDCDPLLEIMASTVESPEFRPVGVDVLVKSGPLVVLSSLQISYMRKAGTNTLLTVAKEKIVEYVKQAGYPEPFKQSALHDIMRNAGADRVTDVSCAGSILVSPASRVFKDSLEDPSGVDLLEDWSGDSYGLHVPAITDIAGVVANEIISEEFEPGGDSDAWAATHRTLRYVVDEDDITFIEV